MKTLNDFDYKDAYSTACRSLGIDYIPTPTEWNLLDQFARRVERAVHQQFANAALNQLFPSLRQGI